MVLDRDHSTLGFRPHPAGQTLAKGVFEIMVENEGEEEFQMISRIWHGWTQPQNADAYEALLKSEIFREIQSRQITGYRGIRLLRRELDQEVEFVTIMSFDSMEAVRAFAGEDYEVAVVPPKARALLSRFDARSQHYEVRVEETV
jgi:heme-degrading monooxygenase HmoA